MDEQTGHRAVTVLVVDDQAPFREAARGVIARLPDFRVVGEAESGEASIDEARRLAPDVIVMDVRLPGISGFEATRRVLAERAATVVVLVSTYPPEDLAEDPAACGAVAFVPKEALTAQRLRELWALNQPNISQPNISQPNISQRGARGRPSPAG